MVITARTAAFTDRLDTIEGRTHALHRAADVLGALPPETWPQRSVDLAAQLGLPLQTVTDIIIDTGEEWIQDPHRRARHQLAQRLPSALTSPTSTGPEGADHSHADPARRWAELAERIHPGLPANPHWPVLAEHLSRAADSGYDITTRLPLLIAQHPLPGRHAARDLDLRLISEWPHCLPPTAPPPDANTNTTPTTSQKPPRRNCRATPRTGHPPQHHPTASHNPTKPGLHPQRHRSDAHLRHDRDDPTAADPPLPVTAPRPAALDDRLEETRAAEQPSRQLRSTACCTSGPAVSAVACKGVGPLPRAGSRGRRTSPCRCSPVPARRPGQRVGVARRKMDVLNDMVPKRRRVQRAVGEPLLRIVARRPHPPFQATRGACPVTRWR